jgi:hypothetical protein
LKGLPAGALVAAQGVSGDGAKTASVVRAFSELILKTFAETRTLLATANRPMYVGILGEVWARLKGHRAAIYQTQDEQKLGLFSLVAILDTEDAGKLLAFMRALARIADEKDPASKKELTSADIARLVKEMGDARYRVREQATLKLRLLGERALPALKQGIASADVETSRRASRLWEQIARAGAGRRKELLSKELPRHLRPTLTFLRRKETLAGQSVDVAQIKLAEQEVAAAKQLRGLMGPDWDRVRLATSGQHVVVLLGSDVALLEQTLVNLKEGRPGLAGSKALEAFNRQANPERRVEFHVSAQRLLALISAPGENPRLPAEPGKTLTSFALTASPDGLQLDVRIPSEEIRVIGKEGHR